MQKAVSAGGERGARRGSGELPLINICGETESTELHTHSVLALKFAII